MRRSAGELHGVGKVLHGLQLVAGDIPGGGAEQGGDAVDDRGAGVLHRGGLHHVELRPGVAQDLPVAHVAVVRTVDLADGLLLHGDALHGLDGDHRGHADGIAGLDLPAQGFAVDVLVDEAGDMLLGDALDGEAQLVADGLGGIPGVGRLEVGGVGRSRGPWPGRCRTRPRCSCRLP